MPCRSSFGNPLIKRGASPPVFGSRSSNSQIAEALRIAGGLASADGIKIKAPKRVIVGSPKAYDFHKHRRGPFMIPHDGARASGNLLASLSHKMDKIVKLLKTSFDSEPF